MSSLYEILRPLSHVVKGLIIVLILIGKHRFRRVEDR